MKKTLITLLACTSLSFGYSQTSNTPCQGVTPNFESLADLPSGGIQFTNTTDYTLNSTYTYEWDFGNGEASTEKDPFMMYDEGTYTVKLSIIGSGCKSVVEKEVEFSYNGK